jgi:hypothetical protein
MSTEDYLSTLNNNHLDAFISMNIDFSTNDANTLMAIMEKQRRNLDEEEI